MFYFNVQVRLHSIYADDQIRGLMWGDYETRILVYADDVAVVCSSREKVLRGHQHTREFESISGAELNPKKTFGA